MILKMKYILLMHCTFVWCVGLSMSSKLNLNGTVSEKRKVNASKYSYWVDDETSTKLSSTNSFTKPMPSEFYTTPSSVDICNATSGHNNSSHRFKRFVFYLGDESTTAELPSTPDRTILSDKFLNCTHITVEAGCFRMLPNRSVYVPAYNRLFDRSNYVINKGFLFVCPDFFDQLEEKFPPNIDTISIAGTGISTVCIILHMIMFCAVEKLRNLPGFCLLSLCIALLMTYTNSFIQMTIPDEAGCRVIGMFMIYSLLSSFFWMNVISFDVWYAIRLATLKLRLSADGSMLHRFSLYSGYGWGMPLLILIIAIVVDHVSEDLQYKLIFRTMTCWFQYRTALLLYFVLPVIILLVMNVVFFITSFLMITRTRSDSGSQDAFNLRSRLFMSLRLGSAMGLMWFFGIIATITQREWIYYLHSLFTALQGVFIFFSFTLNKKTHKAYKKVMENKKISIFSTKSRESKF